MNKVDLEQLSFIGRRSDNQDQCTATCIKENIYFLAVADGMGGAIGGKYASKIVLDTALYVLWDEYSGDVIDSELKGILERIFIEAQHEIAKNIKLKTHLAGMGTTLTCVLIHHDKYVWGNIGDSRIYLLKKDNFLQITEDHTFVEEYIKESGGNLPEHIIKQYGNYLRKALDGGTDLADISPLDKDYELLEDGDIFLLCSDGLIANKVLKDTSVFRDYILGTKNIKTAAEQLITYAFRNGSKDNVSVVLAEFGKRKRIHKNIKYFKFPPRIKKEEQKNIITSKTSIIVFAISILIVAFVLLHYIRGNLRKLNATSKAKTVLEKVKTK